MNKSIRITYFLIFCWLGFLWYFQSWTFALPLRLFLIAFYFLHNAFAAKKPQYISNTYVPFFMLGSLLIFHALFYNLINHCMQISIPGYTTWGALAEAMQTLLDLGTIYVTIYVMSRFSGSFNDDKSDIFYKGFSLGANLFAMLFIMSVRVSFGNFTTDDSGISISVLGVGMNTNYIGSAFVQYFFMNLIAYFHQKRKLARCYHIAFCILDFIVIFICHSRANMGGLVLGIIIALMLRKPKVFIVAFLAIGLFLFAYFNEFVSTIDEIMPTKFTFQGVSNSLNRGATGRSYIWQDYMTNALNERNDRILLFGHVGLLTSLVYQKPVLGGDYINKAHILTARSYNGYGQPHSGYIVVFLYLGGLGLIVYLMVSIKVLFRLFSGIIHGRIRWYYLSVFLDLMIANTTEGALFNNLSILCYSIVLPQVFNNVDDQKHHITVLDFYNIFLKRKWITIGITLLFIVCSFYRCMTMPLVYKTNCVLSPSPYTKQLGVFPGAIIARILRGNTILKKTAEKFDLVNVYGQGNMSQTLEYLQRYIIHVQDSIFGRIITFEVMDTSQDRALKISNFMLDCLNGHMHEMYSETNTKLCNSYSQMSEEAGQELAKAEEELSRFQQANGLVLANSQVSYKLNRINSMRNQISAKEREIYTLQSYSSASNVRLKLAQSQLEAMRSELQKLEGESETLSTSGIPALMTEYNKLLMHVSVAEINARRAQNLVEAVRTDLKEFMPPFYVIDPAGQEIDRVKPFRAATMIIGACAGFWLGIIVSFIDYRRRKVI